MRLLHTTEWKFEDFFDSEIPRSVLATSEVIPSRAMRALEGEGRGLSHLEVVARGGGCGAG
jgi:hypothetical protein